MGERIYQQGAVHFSSELTAKQTYAQLDDFDRDLLALLNRHIPTQNGRLLDSARKMLHMGLLRWSDFPGGKWVGLTQLGQEVEALHRDTQRTKGKTT